MPENLNIQNFPTASEMAAHIREIRENSFKEREYNEKHCFDLAVAGLVKSLKEKNPDFDDRAFFAMIGAKFIPTHKIFRKEALKL